MNARRAALASMPVLQVVLERLTMSVAVRSRSLADSSSLGGSYADQITCRDLASTRKTVPLPRPNVEFSAGFGSLFTVSASRRAFALGLPIWSRFRRLAGGLGGSGGQGTVRRVCSRSPRRCWSVRTASASLGSVTTWKTWSPVSRFARYWSSPLDILSRYTVCTPERSAAHGQRRRAGHKERKPLHTTHDIQTRGSSKKSDPCISPDASR